MGKVFGLTEFDANLIIAVVQDQARRGHRPAICPRMGEPQLRMIPAPSRQSIFGKTPVQRWVTISLALVVLSAAELVALWLLFRA